MKLTFIDYDAVMFEKHWMNLIETVGFHWVDHELFTEIMKTDMDLLSEEVAQIYIKKYKEKHEST